MKTMKLQKQLSNLIVLILLLVSAPVWAGTQWDVAVLFFGKNPASDIEFQKDIDRNVQELAQIRETNSLNVSVYRELPSETYATIKGKKLKSDRAQLAKFLKSAYSNKKSKKLLVIYGHGTGPSGLKEMPTAELKKTLSASGIQLDVLWFDSCFMGNFEFLYEIRSFSDYTIASQEAEFTSGLPFESLNSLATIESSSEASLFLAKSYIESYSYQLKGSQRENVSSSSATVAVIDNQQFDEQIDGLKIASEYFKSLPAETQKKLRDKMKRSFKMENPSLVDLGRLLIELRLQNKDKALDQTFTKLIRDLNIDSVKKLKTNTRLKVTPPVPGAQLVYGFNGWKNGYEEEFNGSIFEDLIPHDEFMKGPSKKAWPTLTVDQQYFYVVPFVPGVSSFNYYWINATTKKALTKEQEVNRTTDIYETAAQSRFIAYSAYTQAIGKNAEKYTGLNVTLLGETPSFDYFESEFNQAVQWLAL
jgi:hypothetical protein